MPTLEELRLFAKHHFYRRVVDYPARDGSLGVVSLGYEAESYEARLRTYEGRFNVEVRGEIPFRAETHRVLSITAGRADAEQRLLVLAGVHGNEQAGLLAVFDLLDSLDSPRTELRNVAVLILTPVNPVGAAWFSRYNGEGYDINRDFVRFGTVEARIVREVFDTFRPTFVVSLHEGPQDATFMFTNTAVEPTLARRLLSTLEARGTVLATHDYFGRELVPRGLAAPTRAMSWLVSAWAKVLKMMATNAYAEQRGVPEITLESSWRSKDRVGRLRAHSDLVMALVGELSAP